MPTCRLCHTTAVADLIDFGPQPISNRFLSASAADEALFPMVLSQCQACGLVQLRRMPPAAELMPQYSWIAYNEPEGHLDDLADNIARLPGLTRDAIIRGLSAKDDSLLRRMQQRGFPRTCRIDLKADLEVSTPGAGVETVQDRLDRRRALALAAKRGRAQVIIARHIVEHAHDLRGFLDALAELVAPDGYLVIEVPDCRPAFRLRDCTILWEEHASYFTAATLPNVFAHLGQAIVSLQAIPNGFEHLLVGIGRAGTVPPTAQSPAGPGQELTAMRNIPSDFSEQRRHVRELLQQRRGAGEIVLLGAGHLACAFINYLGVGQYLTCVVEDEPNKQGLLMPGSRLPIFGSEALLRKDVRLCLLSVNREVEDKVMRKNQAFVDRGGVFASIFKTSSRCLMS